MAAYFGHGFPVKKKEKKFALGVNESSLYCKVRAAGNKRERYMVSVSSGTHSKRSGIRL